MLKLIMRKESRPVLTAVQMAWLLDEGPLKLQTSKCGNYGNRHRRFSNLCRYLDDGPFSHKNTFDQGWSNLAATDDGCGVVALDRLGRQRWYNVDEHTSTTKTISRTALPVSK